MPQFLVPRQSSAHRIAAIALYRTILTQCRGLPHTPEQRDELKHIVRNRFKQSQHVHSVRRLRISFEAGYEAIEYLDAAVGGKAEAKDYITGLLERAPAKVKQAPQSRSALEGSERAHEEEAGTDEPKVLLFDRPLPLEKLTGKRHVPVLFNANHIPVLRLKKPQPASLSRFIRQRVEQRQARHDRRARLHDELRLAKREDEWDDLTAELTGQQEERSLKEAISGTQVEPQIECTWSEALKEALSEVHRQLNEEKEKNRIMGEKMQAVVDRETEAFEKEKSERKRVNMVERFRRRDEKRQAAAQEQDAVQSEPMVMAK